MISALTAGFSAQNSKLRTGILELRTGIADLGARISDLRISNLGTRRSELEDQNSELRSTDPKSRNSELRPRSSEYESRTQISSLAALSMSCVHNTTVFTLPAAAMTNEQASALVWEGGSWLPVSAASLSLGVELIV